MTTSRENMAKEAKNLEFRALSASKNHYTVALKWNRVNFWQGTLIAIVTPILSIGTTSSIIVQYFFDSLWWTLLTFGLSLIVSILTSVVALHKPDEVGKSHEHDSYEYRYISDEARIFYNIDVHDENKSDQELANQIKDLYAKLHSIDTTNKGLPSWIENNDNNQGSFTLPTTTL